MGARCEARMISFEVQFILFCDTEYVRLETACSFEAKSNESNDSTANHERDDPLAIRCG